MRKFRDLTLRFPIAFSILVITLSMWLMFLPAEGHFGWGMISANLKGRFAVSALLVVLIFLLGMGKGRFGVRGFASGFLGGWVLLLIGAVYLAVQLVSLDLSTFSKGLNSLIMVAFLFEMFCTGLFEEVLMRGVVYQHMASAWRGKKNGILASAVISSILFGLVHLLNYAEGYLVATVTQIVFTTFIGIYLCGIFLKSGNLWSVIFLHAGFDFLTLFFQQEFIESAEAATSATADLPLPMGLVMIAATLPLCILGIRTIYCYADANKELVTRTGV